MTPYLYTHQNPHASIKANGLRFHGHPARKGGLSAVRVIVIHTAETAPDLTPPDPRAENVADYQSRTDRPSSYHRIWDSDSTVLCLPDEAVAFGARGANTIGLHGSFATYASQWASLPEAWTSAALENAAETCREWALRYRIPMVKITRADYEAGKRGFVAHADVDPERRSDPGVRFPWPRFLDLVRHPEENDMTPEQAKKLDQAHAALGRIDRFLQESGQMRPDGKPARYVGQDLKVIRLAARALAAKAGLRVKHDAPDEVEA